MQYLTFDFSENTEQVHTIEAMASTTAAQHGAVMAEVQQILEWAWRHFSHSHGPVEESNDWDHDLQVRIEDGRWHAVTLTLTGSERFVESFVAAFSLAHD